MSDLVRCLFDVFEGEEVDSRGGKFRSSWVG